MCYLTSLLTSIKELAVSKNFRIKVEKDHLQKLTTARPIPALAELIWNSLDADATRVDVNIESENVLNNALIISDNGHGISYDEVRNSFAALGGSWKKINFQSRGKKRFLHGKEGKGRFKALTFGQVADWESVYKDKTGTKFRFKISMTENDITNIRVTSPEKVEPDSKTGVLLRITELKKDFDSLSSEASLQSLSEIFAIYLTHYKDASIFIENEKLDPEKAILKRERSQLSDIVENGETYPVNIEIIEWVHATERKIYLCGAEGFPYFSLPISIKIPGHQFSAYLQSDYISYLQESGLLDFVGSNDNSASAINEANCKIKEIFKESDKEKDIAEITRWKNEDIYPYKGQPTSKVDEAARQVFDIVALNVKNQLPDFDSLDQKNKKYQMRMLRTAIERGPEELQLILTEVLDLPKNKQNELYKLLADVSLSNIITASQLVSDRLKLLVGLEALIFEPDTKKVLKERSQLHRIIADNNTWIFGEEFNLTVDDESLTQVLKKHRDLIGSEVIIDEPVKRIDDRKGIVDLMLSKSIPQSRSDQREHLIIELKRPSVKIGSEELTQIKRYAYTIADDERFRDIKTRWTFWVISNDLDKFALTETNQNNKPKGVVAELNNITVWVKTWSEILNEAKAKMKFVQEKLQANIGREHALDYLKETYKKYLDA